MIERLSHFNKLKHQIFYKEDEFVHLGYDISIDQASTLIKRVKNKEILEMEKFFLSENDMFFQQMIIILVEIRSKIEKFFEVVDNGITFILI